MKQEIVGNAGVTLWVVMGTLALVLLIACANVAGLLLVTPRPADPNWRFGRRLAPADSDRAAIARESMTLGVLGGALGLGPAYVALGSWPSAVQARCRG